MPICPGLLGLPNGTQQATSWKEPQRCCALDWRSSPSCLVQAGWRPPYSSGYEPDTVCKILHLGLYPNLVLHGEGSEGGQVGAKPFNVFSHDPVRFQMWIWWEAECTVAAAIYSTSEEKWAHCQTFFSTATEYVFSPILSRGSSGVKRLPLSGACAVERAICTRKSKNTYSYAVKEPFVPQIPGIKPSQQPLPWRFAWWWRTEATVKS